MDQVVGLQDIEIINFTEPVDEFQPIPVGTEEDIREIIKSSVVNIEYICKLDEGLKELH